jgi:hypothetical protein
MIQKNRQKLSVHIVSALNYEKKYIKLKHESLYQLRST